MATPPDFTAGSVLTAAQMDQIGLWKVATTSFTNAAYVQVDSCFTSDFVNYRAVLNIYSSSTSGRYCHAQLSIAGTPTTTGYYSKGLWYDITAGNTTFVDYDIQTTKFCLGPIGYANTGEGSYSFDIFRPKDAAPTRFTASGSGLMAGSYYTSSIAGGLQTGATSFDGLRILPSASNIYGTLTIYGYNNLA